MKQREPHNGDLRTPSMWFSALFLSLMIAVGIMSMFPKNEGVSIVENRPLAPMPVFSVWSLFYGSYTDSLELFYADNFPLRDGLVQAATSIRDLSGYHNEIVYYQTATVEPEVPVRRVDTAQAVKKDSVRTPLVRKDTLSVRADFARSSSIVIYENRAIQIFTVSSDGPEMYADMVNLYKETFDSLEIYCLVAPTQTDFYLPDEYKKSSNFEDRMIKSIRAQLDSTVRFVDAHGELGRHIKEYIYFNTDHHWTGRGAYYAYVAFCRSAGIKPYSLDSLDRTQIKRKFLGSLYGITLDKRLKQRPDSVEYFRLPIPTRTFRWNKDLSRYEFSRLFANAYNYTNFIGGDHPMVRIESDVNTKKILVIKDSYGNAVMPFLALHYGTVYVMDYRYFDVNVRKFVEDNKITAIMFLHNTFAANAKYTAYRGRYVLNWRSTARRPTRDSIVTDSKIKQDENP